ncbi:MAG: PhnD/SsuA/transferrin family substrate-binding protein [Candidatus Electrothrix sp. Rat3]|nr:PhnD/SsuA/transferrin family substrate-binding protein [Candidatus Electrothrix rattekaaiensis]
MINTGYAAGTDSEKFYYFNPDSSQSNLTRLKQEMERFLDKKDLVLNFQPFAKYHDFHREMLENIPAFVFLPDWYYQQSKKKSKLKPLLQPVHKGRTTYRKVLLTSQDSTLTLQGLSNKLLAITTMGNETPDLLDRLLFNQFKIKSNSLNIIMTPKDSDALFALAVGQVNAALVSKNNLQRIGRINPRILQIVRPLAESQPIPLPILCAGNGKVLDEKIMELKKIFLEANDSDDSADLMEMLQIDAWHNYAR